MRKLHEWFGLVTAIIVIIVSLTGILLVHKKSLGLDKVVFDIPGYSVPTGVDAWDAIEAGDHLLVNTKQGLFVKVAGEWQGTLPSQVRQLIYQEGMVYACAKDGLYRSQDYGLTWKNLLPGQEIRTALFAGPEIIYATGKGLYRMAQKGEGAATEIAPFGKKPLDVRKIQPVGDTLVLAAKEGVFSVAGPGKLTAIDLPIVENGASLVTLQRVITDLHNGDFFGRWAYLAIDATGVGLVLLSITGVYLWYLPWKKRRQVKSQRH